MLGGLTDRMVRATGEVGLSCRLRCGAVPTRHLVGTASAAAYPRFVRAWRWSRASHSPLRPATPVLPTYLEVDGVRDAELKRNQGFGEVRSLLTAKVVRISVDADRVAQTLDRRRPAPGDPR
jgi:hypothetical protein